MSRVFLMILIVLLAIIFVFPVYWMVMGSFTASMQSLRVPPEFWPEKPNIKSYIKMFQVFPTFRWMLNSLVVALAVTVVGVSVSCLAGYAFAKKDFVGKNVIFWLFMSTLMIPFYCVMIPLFMTIRNLGLFNTYPGMFLPLTCGAANIFLARQYISTLPSEIIDAAKIDGCSEFGTFARIILPLSKPLVAVLTIFTFVYGWKSFMWPLIATSSINMRTFPVAVATAVSYPEGYTEFGLAMAAATLVALPVLVVFAFCQRYFIKGITIGGVKG